jgi:AcrR family transcriptional regulator
MRSKSTVDVCNQGCVSRRHGIEGQGSHGFEEWVSVPVVATRDDYFEAGLAILMDAGPPQLKIGSLCRAVGVTTGSFYGYFGGWSGFVDQFLEYWEQQQTDRIVRLTSAQQDPHERLKVIQQLAADIPHEAEAALRAWGYIDKTVSDAMRRVDARRHAAVRGVLDAIVPDPADADLLAVIGITLLVGLQQWRSPVDRLEFCKIQHEWEMAIRARAGFTRRALSEARAVRSCERPNN